MGDGSPFESGLITPDRDLPPVQGGMDVDLTEDKPDTDLNDLMALLQRDEKREVQEANQEILASAARASTDESGSVRFDTLCPRSTRRPA